MRYSLDKKVVFITGAAGGIGAATARKLYAQGASLVLTDMVQVALDKQAREFDGSRVLAVTLDVTDSAATEQVVAQAVARFGRIDCVLANAGIAWKEQPATLLSCEADEFEKILNVNLLGVWHTIKACLPEIIKNRGQVLVTSSIYATLNGIANAPYAASKSAVESLTRSLRAELGSGGATASIIYPGWTATPITDIVFGGNALATRMNETALPAFLRRPITPEKLATSIVRGMQQRKPHIIAPARWRPIFWLRGVVNPLTDWHLTRHPALQRLICELEDQASSRLQIVQAQAAKLPTIGVARAKRATRKTKETLS